MIDYELVHTDDRVTIAPQHEGKPACLKLRIQQPEFATDFHPTINGNLEITKEDVTKAKPVTFTVTGKVGLRLDVRGSIFMEPLENDPESKTGKKVTDITLRYEEETITIIGLQLSTRIGWVEQCALVAH